MRLGCDRQYSGSLALKKRRDTAISYQNYQRLIATLSPLTWK
jgi:hypothetical protein